MVPGEIYVIEPLGSSKIIDIKVGNAILKVRTGTDFDINIGDKVLVELTERKVHFFDKVSGNSVYTV